jgi:hypothetical protein
MEDLMNSRKKNFALFPLMMALLLSASFSWAQTGALGKLTARHAASPAAQAEQRQARTPGSPSYRFTLLNYPDTLSTYAEALNLGATTSKIQIVGGYGTDVDPGITPGGFVVGVAGKKVVTESYEAVNDPHVSGDNQAAIDINDSGQIVGIYTDSAGFHGYEMNGGKFTEINAPFAGATNTETFGINDSGEIVGTYTAAGGETDGFTLIGSTWTSISYPGSTYTVAFGVNSAGDVVGQYDNAEGVGLGFLLSGGIYTSIEYPGSTETFATAINDSGDIVGVYCTTSECIDTFEGAQGFLLSGSTFTTIAVPGEFYTEALSINNKGQIVGIYQDAAGVIVSFLATP